MSDKFNFICLKWGNKYHPQYVNILYNSVKKFTTLDNIDFYCYTEDTRGLNPEIKIIPLDTNLQGWWNKITIFQKNFANLEGRILFMDLDMVIIKNIDDLFTHRPEVEFIALPEPTHKGECGSAILRFDVGRYDYIWERFNENKDKIMNLHKHHSWGDQSWIMMHFLSLEPDDFINQPYEVYSNLGDVNRSYNTNLVMKSFPQFCSKVNILQQYPREWFQSYKKDMDYGKEYMLRPETKIIVFHGEPNPHNCESWVREKYWKI